MEVLVDRIVNELVILSSSAALLCLRTMAERLIEENSIAGFEVVKQTPTNGFALYLVPNNDKCDWRWALEQRFGVEVASEGRHFRDFH